MSVVELSPVVKSVEVRRPPDDAFRMFVHEATMWWPLETHALAPENNTKAVRLVVEPRVGGRVYEVTEDAREFDWGEVLAYEPGARFSMTWQLGQPREQSGEIEVRFEAVGAHDCQVTLTHTGWERMGVMAEQMRNGYDNGWQSLFSERYRNYAGTH